MFIALADRQALAEAAVRHGVPQARATPRSTAAWFSARRIFGVGWGMSGICPGPAISLIAFWPPNLLVYLLALFVGSYGGTVLMPSRQRKAARPRAMSQRGRRRRRTGRACCRGRGGARPGSRPSIWCRKVRRTGGPRRSCCPRWTISRSAGLVRRPGRDWPSAHPDPDHRRHPPADPRARNAVRRRRRSACRLSAGTFPTSSSAKPSRPRASDCRNLSSVETTLERPRTAGRPLAAAARQWRDTRPPISSSAPTARNRGCGRAPDSAARENSLPRRRRWSAISASSARSAARRSNSTTSAGRSPSSQPAATAPTWSGSTISDVLREARRMAARRSLRRCSAKSRNACSATIELLTPAHVFPLSTLTVDIAGKDGVVLAGEAAHAFPPIGAQGLNLGLRDVADLARRRSPRPIVARPRLGRAPSATTTPSGARGDLARTGTVVDALFRSLLAEFLPAQALRAGGPVGAQAGAAPAQGGVRRGHGRPLDSNDKGARRRPLRQSPIRPRLLCRCARTLSSCWRAASARSARIFSSAASPEAFLLNSSKVSAASPS